MSEKSIGNPCDWLIDGSLLYRLGDDGANCDEINVAMIHGSRGQDEREAASAGLLAIICASESTQPAEQASAGSIGDDADSWRLLQEHRASAVAQRSEAADRLIAHIDSHPHQAAPRAPSDTQGAEGLPEYARVREEFQIVAGLGATADLDSAMMVVNALLRAALAQQAPDAVRNATLEILGRGATGGVIISSISVESDVEREAREAIANAQPEPSETQDEAELPEERMLHWDGAYGYEADQMLEFGADRHEAALDAAVLACENERVDDTGTDGDKGYNLAIEHCAKAIRALKSTAPKLAEAGKGK